MQIRAIRTHLTKNFLDSPEKTGRVHSVFERAINLQFDDEIITLIADFERGAPDSIELAVRDFKMLKNICVNEIVIYKNKSFRIGFQFIDISDSQNIDNLFHSCDITDKAKIQKKINSFGFYHTLPEKAEDNLQNLIQSIEEKDSLKCTDSLKMLVGLGCGLTPSADDALIGIIATMNFMQNANIPTMTDFAKLVYDISEKRTTDISRKYLRCAMQKRFSLPLIRVVSSLLSNDNYVDFPSLATLLNTGHSSGKDTLRGVFIAISNFIIK